MKLTAKRFLAVLLSVCMVASTSIFAFAAPSETTKDDTAHKLDRVLDTVLDGALGLVGRIFTQKGIPTVKEYGLGTNDYFYEGTDGEAEGDGWKLGFASASVIPSQWRRNADNEPDENGWLLNKKYYFGGYFTSRVDKIYDDETVNLAVLSTGSDANENGVDDIIIFAALDGIGFSSVSVREVREATEKALLAKGVTSEDIIGFDFNVTHAHSVVDPQGMGMDMFLYLFKNKLFGTKDRSVQKELLEAICNNTASAVVSAYEKMEEGSLYYFETEDVSNYSETINLVNDKNDRGTKIQSFFACFLFEGVSGEKTVLANIGMHPTKADRDSMRVCGDVPHYIGKAMSEAGYNFVYIQGAQGAVGLSLESSEEGDAWAEKNALSYEEWVERYGEKYTAKTYAGNDKDPGEAGYKALRASGYTIAHLIIDAIDYNNKVEPTLSVSMSEIALPLDYGLIYLGAVTGLLGFNTVKLEGTESGYGIATEIGYIGLGDDVGMLVMPGEISPSIIFGTDPRFEGDTFWTGETSWSGKDWEYKTLEEYVRIATGDNDKKVIVMGIANDAIGYVFPDTDVVSCFLSDSFGIADSHYEELLISSTKAASSILEGFLDLFDVAK